MAERPKAKPKPAARPARTSAPVTETLGKSTTKSRQQAEEAAKRTSSLVESDTVPRAPDGHPLTRIEMTSGELIPTGQFANISVGPAKVVHWIDARDPDPISQEEMDNIAKALNLLGDVVQIDVIAVQRNLTLESMQQQVSGDGDDK